MGSSLEDSPMTLVSSTLDITAKSNQNQMILVPIESAYATSY